MRKITFLLFAMLAFSWYSNAQTSTLYFTAIDNGCCDTEKWVSITTGPDGTGAVIFAQGNGTYGDAQGLITDAAFTVDDGVTYYINAYDRYADSWDGDTYEIRSEPAGGGFLVANNGGDSPTDGTDDDTSSAWDDTQAQELEVSEAFSFTAPTCTSATVDSSTIVGDCLAGTFTVDVVVSSVGDGTFINDGANTYAVVAGTVTAGPYADGASVTLTVEHSDGVCDFSLGDFQNFCPPSNIDCDNATPIACDETINTTSAGSTGNQEGSGCSMGDNGVWFTFTGTGADMTVSVDASFDHEVAITSGACGALVNVNCDDQSVGTESHTFASTLSETYYVYVAHYASGNTTTGTVDITLTCAVVPECTSVVVDSSTTVDSCNPDGTGTFTIDHVVSNAGDAGSVFDDGTTTYPVVVGTVTTGPYNSGDSVTVEVTGVDPVCDFTVGTFDYTCPQPGPVNDDLANATPISCGNTYAGDTSAATIDEADAPDTATIEADTNADTDSPNVWFGFMGTGDIVTLSTCVNTDFDTEMFVFTGASGALTCIDDGYDECGGSAVNYTAETTFTSVLGTQYWISIEGYNAADVGTFELVITCTAPPTCIPAMFTLTDGGNTCPSEGGFSIDVDVTALGTATSVNILVDGLAVISGIDGTASPYNIGGLASATDYDITVEDAADDTCASTETHTTTVCPPENDLPGGAVTLSVGDTLCESILLSSNVGATDSGEGDPSCGVFGYVGGDVWFKVVVPSTGELTIETSVAVGSSILDTTMEVYSGSAGSLMSIECDDDDSPAGAFSLVELTGLTPGDVLLIRVWEYGDNIKGDFNICAWSPSTLGLEDNTFNGFSYYPNPVKNVLSLESPRAIDNIEVFNVLGQRVITLDSQNTIQNIDMSNLESGMYLVKVSIENQVKTIRVIKE
ncbi:hypothetical protein A9Q86_08090 [Flavobacteriales bacterium 33_180_T64]|nr:hypothetical protein A9Q86_08090 [Flavobacteriales bacterium 33_180_T64]